MTVDRIKALKYENTVEGSHDDRVTTMMNPLQDTMPMFKEVLIIDDETDIAKTTIIQQGMKVDSNHELVLFDRVSSEKKLSELVSSALTLGPTGFVPSEDVVINYNSTDRTITLSGTFTAYYRGKAVTSVVYSGLVSAPHNEATGHIYGLSFNGTALAWTTDAEMPFTDLLVAYVYFGASDKFAIRECHGFMPWQVHKEFHDALGTYKLSGGTISGIVIDSNTATERRPVVSAATLYDEDLKTINPLLTASSIYTQLYLTSTGISTYIKDTSDIVALSANRPYYNLFSGSTWGQAAVGVGNYMCVWLIAVPTTADAGSQKHRYLFLQGQSQGNLVSQQALQPQDLNLGTLNAQTKELVFITKFIIRYIGGNWSVTSVTNLTGTRAVQVGSPAGVFLSSVSTDATLTGDGTPDNPLSAAGSVARHRLTYTFNDVGLVGIWADIGSISSQFCGAPISLTNPTIERVEVACKNTTANFTFGIYQHDGNQVNASLIRSITISGGVSYLLTTGLSDALTIGKQLSIKSTDVTALPGDVVITVTIKEG